MGILDAGVVDWLGIEKLTGAVVLTLVDDEDWVDEQRHLALLQNKLNTYLAFIESGEVIQRVKSDLGRAIPDSTPIKVNILAKYDLPVSANSSLEDARRAFVGAGFALSHKVVPVLN